MAETYQPSGKAGRGYVPLALAIGLIAAVVGGFVYQKLIGLIPFIYINFLLTIGLAALLAAALGFAIKRGKCRHVTAAAVLAVLIGATADAASFYTAYREWIADLTEELEKGIQNGTIPPVQGETPESIANQATFGDWIDMRVETGWGLGRTGKGVKITGIFVWLLWLAELGTLCGVPLVTAMAGARSPFCEPCVRWTDTHEIGTISHLTAVDIDRVRDAGVEGLLSLQPSNGDRTLEFSVHACPACTTTRFVQVDLEGPDDEESDVEDETLIAPTKLTEVDARALHEKFAAPARSKS